MDTKIEHLLADVAEYYSGKLRKHGKTPEGVDWNGIDGQILRFEQLAKIIEGGGFSVNDLGCGYGALYSFLSQNYGPFQYYGWDVSAEMIRAAKEAFEPYPNAHFECSAVPRKADYGVASGIFNVRLGIELDAWEDYCANTIETLHETSSKGFAFNCLTSYSDDEKKRPDLYYADPCKLFDWCKRRFSRHVSLLHDYGLYEFTILVRKE